jgi:hypothetical protein
MYTHYKNDMISKNQPAMARSTFDHYYDKEFSKTVKIHPPQLDTCNICLQFYALLGSTKDPAKKELLTRFQNKHLDEADGRYSKLRDDKAHVTKDPAAMETNITIAHGKVT